tara:strand:- start:66 stop:698 length:633 start_codon:yes stop_codon:yes gene_type:complete
MNNNISNIPNAILMQEARESLKGNWGLPITATIICMLISGLMQFIPFLGWIALVAIQPQIGVGASIFYLNLSRKKEITLEQLFETFKNGNRFGNIIGTYLLMFLCVMLGFICLIIPGIILCFAFSQTFFILSEDENIGPVDTLKKSYNMMIGNKWKYFCLTCRFIGWTLLSIITLGIGFLWFYPYFWVSTAKFYESIEVDNSNVALENKN